MLSLLQSEQDLFVATNDVYFTSTSLETCVINSVLTGTSYLLTTETVKQCEGSVCTQLATCTCLKKVFKAIVYVENLSLDVA